MGPVAWFYSEGLPDLSECLNNLAWVLQQHNNVKYSL